MLPLATEVIFKVDALESIARLAQSAVQRQRLRGVGKRGLEGGKRVGDVYNTDDAATRELSHGLYHAFELNQVAGPGIVTQGVQRRGIERAWRRFLRLDGSRQHHIGKLGNVLGALAQRGHAYDHAGQQRIQPWIEDAARHQFGQRRRRRGNNSRVVAIQF